MAKESSEDAAERTRQLLSSIADRDDASAETRWAYHLAERFVQIGQRLQQAQRDAADPQSEKLVTELSAILLRCRHLVWGLDLEELSTRQVLVLSCIANAPVPDSTTSTKGLETLLYGVTDMRYGIFSGMHRYDEVFNSPEEIAFAARAVQAFHGALSEPGVSKWDIINDFLDRHGLASRSTPPANRLPGYKHPLLKVWQRAQRETRERGGNADSTVE